jgi:hypothetical protein
VKAKGKVTPLRDVGAPNVAMFRLNDLYLPVPPLIAVGKQQNVVKGSIEGVQVSDVV